jgi:hypothetical protein
MRIDNASAILRNQSGGTEIGPAFAGDGRGPTECRRAVLGRFMCVYRPYSEAIPHCVSERPGSDENGC